MTKATGSHLIVPLSSTGYG